MKRTFKRFIPFILVLCVLLTSVFTAYAIEGDKYGENIKVKFDEETGVLFVSGSGEVTDLYPRDNKKIIADTIVETDTKVKHLVIDEGITSVVNSFNDLQGLSDIVLPESLTNIEESFINCDKLKSVDFPSSLISIGVASFNDCDGITQLHLNAGLQKISSETSPVAVFNSLDSLETLFIPAGVELTGAFSDCKALSKIYFEDHTVTINQGKKISETEEIRDSFRACHENATIFVEGKYIAAFWDYEEYYAKLDNPNGYWGFYDEEYSMLWEDYSDGPDVISCTSHPVSLRVEANSGSITIRWTNIINAEKYHVYRRTDNNLDWKKIAEVKNGYYNDTDVKYGITYYYHVLADDNPVGATSDGVSIIYPDTTLLKRCIPTGKTAVELNFLLPVSSKGYIVYRSETGKAGTWTRIAKYNYFSRVGEEKITSYTAKGLKAGKTYYFCVKHFTDEYGKEVGNPSNKFKVVAGKPLAEADFTFNRKAINVEWNAMSDISCYRVYVKKAGEIKYKTAETIYNPLNTSTKINWGTMSNAYVKVRVFYKDGTHQITDAIRIN